MKKRVLAALLVSAMVVATVVGCGSKSSSEDSSKKETTEASDKKDSDETVTVVTAGTGEPYSLLADDGTWTGIDAEMWDEIEKRTGWKVELKQAAQTIIEDLAKEKGFEVKLYEDSAVGMNDLKLGRIAAYANTTTNVNAFTHNNEDANFRFFDENLMANNVAYFLPKTERGDKLTEELNDVIQEMLDDGTVAKITEKWMYSDMTKLIQK